MASEIWFESRELERENHALYVICAIMLLAEHSKGRLFTAGWSEFLATSVECALAWSQSGAMAFAEFLEWAENRVDDAESKCHFSLARAAIMASMAVKQCAKTSAQCDVERTEGHPAAFDCLSPRTAMRDDAVAEVWRRVLGRTDTAAEAIGLIRRVVGLNGNSTDEESGG
jgi:hypothetical protein